MIHPDITVIIPTWNGRHLLAECLPALQKQTYRNFKVIIAENGSTDKTAEWVKENYPEYRIIQFSRNHGFALACSHAVKCADTPLVALLNNDAIPASNWLKSLHDAMHRHPDAGSCASKMLKASDPSIIDNCGHRFSLTGSVDIGIGMPSGKFQHELEIFGACGGAVIYRRNAFMRVGGFDPLYGSYIEDFDINYRLRLLGYRCFFIPDAAVIHKGAQTFSQYSSRHGFLCARNMWITLLKNCSRKFLLQNFFKIVHADMQNVIYYSSRQMGITALKARLAVLLALPAILIRRKKIQAARIKNDEEFSCFENTIG